VDHAIPDGSSFRRGPDTLSTMVRLKTVDCVSLGPWIEAFPDARWNEVETALRDVLGCSPHDG